MNSARPASGSAQGAGITALSAGFIVLAGLAAYHNSFGGPFIFDDVPAITDNPTIRHLWPLGRVLWPSGAGISGATGRPLVNLSFAVNYALGGLGVRGYHVFNLAVHLCGALTLFGVVRRTWAIWKGVGGIRGEATAVALAVALIWTVHPLQTESVTYVMSRTESLVGLFYLLTVYCFIRASADRADPPGPTDGLSRPARPRKGWALLSAAACLLGMCTKEVMVTAPLVVLLYDRTFLAGSFRKAWRRRWWLYFGLAVTWLRIGYLLVSEHGSRGNSAGFGLGVPWWSYGLTQCWAIVHYLILSFWPHPLVLDYGMDSPKRAIEVAPQAVLLVLLGTGSIWALFRPRWRAFGFAGACFFLILAPSSSIYPLPTELISEHRMYLPLAAVVTVAAGSLYSLAGRHGLAACLIAALGLGWMTVRRNDDYRSTLSIWSDTVAKRPDNSRARNDLAVALVGAGRPAEAVAHYQAALRLNPKYTDAYSNFGYALSQLGRMPEAIGQYRKALRLDPDNADVHNNLGSALLDSGAPAEARVQLQRALALRPDFPLAEYNLANAFRDLKETAQAIAHYERALALNPDYAEAHNNLGMVLGNEGQVTEALRHLEQALRLRPDYPEAHENLGRVLVFLGRNAEGQEHLRTAARLKNEAGK